MATDERQAAAAKVNDLITVLKSNPIRETAAIVEECDGLARAIAAFHMEGIRFRIYNVDRLLRNTAEVAPIARTLLEEARHHLEAAGFHTRSHQAPS